MLRRDNTPAPRDDRDAADSLCDDARCTEKCHDPEHFPEPPGASPEPPEAPPVGPSSPRVRKIRRPA